MSSKSKNSEINKSLFSSAETRKQMVQLCIVLLLAIAIRVIYLLQYKAHSPYYSVMIVDSRYYDEWAQRVAAGKGYGPKPFYMAPLYPYFLAIMYKLFGHSFTPIYIFQMALGVFNACLVYVLGRKLFSHASGLVSMLFVLFYAPLVYLEAKILTETLAIAINLCSILLLMRAIERPTAGKFLGAGILLGVSTVCRPNSLITIVLFVSWVWLTYRREQGFYIRFFVPLVLGVALAIAPVTARNYFIGKDFVLLTSNGGIVFAQANNKAANGVSSAMAGFSASIMTQQQEEMEIASKVLGRSVKPSESAAFWFRQGLEFITEYPDAFIKLLGLKLLWSLHDVEARCSFNVYLEKTFIPILRYLAVPFSLLAGSALFGMIRGRKLWRPGATLIALYALSIFLSLLIFSVSSRYRVPAVPAIAVFAGLGVICGLSEVRRKSVKSVSVFLCCIGLFLGISAIPYPIPKITAGGYNNLGVALVRQGRLDEAIIQYKRALKVKPNHFSVHINLANVLAAKGRLDEAAYHYRQAIRINPSDPKPHFELGVLYGENGRIDDEIQQYKEAISLKPDFGEAHNNLSVALYYKGRYAEAWKELYLAKKYGVSPSASFVKALSSKMPPP